MTHSKLDSNFLQQLGGVQKNSFTNIIDPNPEDNEYTNEPVIISHSSYYDYDNLVLTLNKNKKQFSILCTNIQCIRTKFYELKIFIEMLKQLNLEFSAICLQESWFSGNEDISQIKLECYSCIAHDKSCTSKGELIIYLNNRYKYVNKMKLTKYRTWEGQIIKVNKGDNLSKPVIIGNIYRPPTDLLDSYTAIISEFTPILNNFESTNYDVILAGDFNINLLKINEKPKINEYFNMLTNHSFFPKITLPTRLSIKYGTFIDNFFCKLTENTIHTTSGILVKKFFDHQSYFR